MTAAEWSTDAAMIRTWEQATRAKILDQIESDEMGEFIDGGVVTMVHAEAEASHVLDLLGDGWRYDSICDVFVRR